MPAHSMVSCVSTSSVASFVASSVGSACPPSTEVVVVAVVVVVGGGSGATAAGAGSTFGMSQMTTSAYTCATPSATPENQNWAHRLGMPPKIRSV